MSKKVIIDEKYIRKEFKKKGGTSSVYVVEERKTKKIYAAKILSSHNIFFDNERDMLELLKDKNIPNIVNLIDSGDGDIVDGNSFSKKQYLILEYAEKGDLSQYITLTGKPLKETHAKLFFSKILKAVQSIHKIGICHRDLKTANILLDNKFNPKICDFGFSTFIQKNLKEEVGTYKYAAPEIYDHRYDGEKVDIFALGVILFNLVTGKYGFSEAKKNNIPYKFIILKNYNKFWNQYIKIDGLKKEFKDLFVKMVAYKLVERYTIEEILKDKWMEEINQKNEKEIEDIELEIYNDFLERESIVNDSTKKKIIMESNSSDDSYGISNDSRSLSNVESNYFDNYILPMLFEEGNYLEYYIEIKGNIKPVKFMNKLIQKIKDEYENENEKNEYSCHINVNKKEARLKFNAIFKKEDIEENDEDEENNEEELEKLNIEEDKSNEDNSDNSNNSIIMKKDCSIEIELFEFDMERYLLRYVRMFGEKEDFYKNLKIINGCVEKI